MQTTSTFSDMVSGERLENCPTHGEFKSMFVRFGKRESWTTCPGCIDDQVQAERAIDDAELKAHRNSSIIRIAAIPERFMSRDLANYDAICDEQREALKFATDYAKDFDGALREGRSLIFCGLPGTGKTHLAVGIAKVAMTRGKTAIFTSAMNAIRTVRETYRRDSDVTERQAIARFAEPDLMILDEVGSQLGTEAEKVTLFDIINARYERMRPMIVISNLGIDGVRDYLGERAFDRLRENGGKAVLFNWGSYRGQA